MKTAFFCTPLFSTVFTVLCFYCFLFNIVSKFHLDWQKSAVKLSFRMLFSLTLSLHMTRKKREVEPEKWLVLLKYDTTTYACTYFSYQS